MNAGLLTVLVGPPALFAALMLYGFWRPPPDSVAALRREYLRLARLGRVQGARQLEERLEALRERQPGRSQQYYLSWLVNDLRRAKR